MKKSCTDQKLLKVLVVEDSIDLQLLLRAMLSEISGVEVIASVESEEEALEAIRSSCTDLAIVDLELDSGTGLVCAVDRAAVQQRRQPLRDPDVSAVICAGITAVAVAAVVTEHLASGPRSYPVMPAGLGRVQGER